MQTGSLLRDSKVTSECGCERMWLLRRAGVLESGVIEAMSAEYWHCLWRKSRGRPSKRKDYLNCWEDGWNHLTSNYITVGVSCISFLAVFWVSFNLSFNIFINLTFISLYDNIHGQFSFIQAILIQWVDQRVTGRLQWNLASHPSSGVLGEVLVAYLWEVVTVWSVIWQQSSLDLCRSLIETG